MHNCTTEHITIDTKHIDLYRNTQSKTWKYEKEGPTIPDPVNSSAYSPFLLSSFPYYKDDPLQLRGSYPSKKDKEERNFRKKKEVMESPPNYPPAPKKKKKHRKRKVIPRHTQVKQILLSLSRISKKKNQSYNLSVLIGILWWVF